MHEERIEIMRGEEGASKQERESERENRSVAENAYRIAWRTLLSETPLVVVDDSTRSEEVCASVGWWDP